MNKQELRAYYLRCRRQTPTEQKEQIDRAITRQVLALPAYCAAKTIFLYCSTAQEIATDAILQHALQSGKRVCVPRVEHEPHCMTARQIQSQKELTPDPRHGIPEPSAQAFIIAPEEIDFCIVPALACNRDGYRLGYGGGYYDRFLGAAGKMCSAALCAQARLTDALPVDEYDIPCRWVITERSVMGADEK